MVPARFLVPLIVALCVLGGAPVAFAQPGVSKAENRMISNIVERWVNDVVRGQNFADGWKIAGAAERGAIKYKDWVSGRQLPVMRMKVLNNPRTSWYVTGRQGNQILLTVSLKTGHGQNAEMIENSTILQKVHGRWLVYAFYADGIFRLGRGHNGSCAQSNCKVTGLNDYNAGGPSTGNGGATTGRISGAYAKVVIAAILGFPFLVLLAIGVFVFRSNRRARRARIAYMSSRA